jgi:PAS domain S-box-containing protein
MRAGAYTPTILHVEDRDPNRHLRRRLMEQAGFGVLEAATLADGMAAAVAHCPEVVLTDIALPDGDGFELTRRLKANPATANIRVIQVSAVFTDAASRVRGLNSGADAYLIEPADPAEFIAVIRAVVRGRQTEDLLHETTQALRLSEQQLRTVIDNTPALVYVVDATGRFMLANRTFCALFGVEPETIVERSLGDIFPAETARQFDENNRRILEGNRTLEYEEIVTHDGQDHTYISMKAPLHDATGRPYAICGVSTDITERKRLETGLKQADRRKDAFIATVAHELRQPLAPIVTALELLRRSTSPETAREAHKVLERQVSQMRRLIDDLLDAARITEGKVTIRTKRVALGDIVTSAVNVVTPLVRERGQELRVQMADRTIWLEADSDRLQQVLSNLLTNAVKFTEPAGRIALTVEPGPDTVAIRVADTGRGIGPELLPHVFDLFTQASSDERGIGVGLAVVRGLVERHGGTVEARSEGVGKGAEFIVRLPVAPAAV